MLNTTQKRKALNMTQKSLAEKVGVTDGMISQYENGLANPSLEVAVKIAKALDCKLDDLIKDQ